MKDFCNRCNGQFPCMMCGFGFPDIPWESSIDKSKLKMTRLVKTKKIGHNDLLSHLIMARNFIASPIYKLNDYEIAKKTMVKFLDKALTRFGKK